MYFADIRPDSYKKQRNYLVLLKVKPGSTKQLKQRDARTKEELGSKIDWAEKRESNQWIKSFKR